MHAALKAIAEHWNAEGLSPTYAELGERLGIHAETARATLARLERRGLVSRVVGKPRCIRLTVTGIEEIAA